jgi:hypothetical protein
MAKMVFLGGTDELQLHAEGKVYRPGDTVNVTEAQRISLRRAGIALGPMPEPDEPVVTPEGQPANLKAAEGLPAGAVVAAIEDVSATEAGTDEPSRRAARKG